MPIRSVAAYRLLVFGLLGVLLVSCLTALAFGSARMFKTS